MITLNLIDANDFVISAILDNETYKLRFCWNDEQHWLMDIRDSGNNDLVRGIKLVPNFPLINQYRRISSNLPHGELVVAVVNQSVTENQFISRNGFISGVFSLVYVNKTELSEILAAVSVEDDYE